MGTSGRKPPAGKEVQPKEVTGRVDNAPEPGVRSTPPARV